MIRLTGILAILVLAAVSGHFGYLHLAAPASPRPELIWVQRELELTPDQLAAVQTLHEECWAQVALLRAQLESERRSARTSGNTAACVAAEDQGKSCTVTFIRRMTALLTPAQQQKYLSLVETCLPPAARTEGATVEQSPGR